MYGYEQFIEVTPEHILQSIPQEHIFEFILKIPFSYSTRYVSPFREDNKPGCRFEKREDGTILFVDFGEKFLTGRTHRNCFRMVMDHYNISLSSSIKIIIEAFNLPTDVKDYGEIVETKVQYNYTHERKESNITDTIIKYDKREYNKLDIKYWSQFLIRPEELLSDNVYATSKFTKTNQKGYTSFTPFKYCYAIDFIDAVKIYQPYQTDYKWLSNCNENHIGNIDNLPPTGHELIIQKSYKDHRVLRNLPLNLNVIWFQNEGCVPSLEILYNLTTRFNIITIFFDNDLAGTIAAMKLVEIINSLRANCARMVHLPNPVTGRRYKDPSHLISKEGRLDLITAVKQILI